MKTLQSFAIVLAAVSCVPASPPNSAPGATVAAPSAGGQGPSLPAAEVWLNPVDSTTGTGEDVIPRVTIMNSGVPLGSGALALLQQGLSLRTWPGLVPVAASFRATDAKGGNSGEPS